MFLLLRLPAVPAAVSVARHSVAGLVPLLDRSLCEDVELLVSEVVTNSVRHAELAPGATVEFSLRASDGVVRVEVADTGRGFDHDSPARPRAVAGSEQASGWGLFLVDQMADRWGATRAGGETRVWFELHQGVPPVPAGSAGVVVA